MFLKQCFSIVPPPPQFQKIGKQFDTIDNSRQSVFYFYSHSQNMKKIYICIQIYIYVCIFYVFASFPYVTCVK